MKINNNNIDVNKDKPFVYQLTNKTKSIYRKTEIIFTTNVIENQDHHDIQYILWENTPLLLVNIKTKV